MAKLGTVQAAESVVRRYQVTTFFLSNRLLVATNSTAAVSAGTSGIAQAAESLVAAVSAASTTVAGTPQHCRFFI